MATLYLRNVPDEVVGDLEQLAKDAHLSVSAFCVRELTQRSRAAKNAALLASLPVLDISREEIVAAIREERDAR